MENFIPAGFYAYNGSFFGKADSGISPFPNSPPFPTSTNDGQFGFQTYNAPDGNMYSKVYGLGTLRVDFNLLETWWRNQGYQFAQIVVLQQGLVNVSGNYSWTDNSGMSHSTNISTIIPDPSTLALLATGVVATTLRRRKTN